MSYEARAKFAKNAAGKALFELMAKKKTNLAVAADVMSAEKLLGLADLLGPEICVLKTHVDILRDFTSDFPKKLQEIALKHHFLIFEDRKFADIGSVVKAQFESGLYHIAEWADIINAHTISGPGIIQGLREGGLKKGRGLLLLAEMSSQGNLAKGEYTRKTIDMAKEYPDFVMGFVAQRKLISEPGLITFTPGVSMEKKGDPLGQQYRTPAIVIGQSGIDVPIVGRSILEAEHPLSEAKRYRDACWEAYETRQKSLSGTFE